MSGLVDELDQLLVTALQCVTEIDTSNTIHNFYDDSLHG